MSIRMLRLYIAFFLMSFAADAQQVRLSEGSINLVSNAQLELIKASSQKLSGLLDLTDRQFAFSIEIKSFEGFNSNLQREHFNENYLESDKYPKATFSGKIIEAIDFSTAGEHEVRAKGELVIHGKTQVRMIKAKLVIANDKIRVSSSFKVPLTDHDISIPRIVSQKIATEIDVTMSGVFDKKSSK